MRPHDRATVGDRRVGDGHLQRRGLDVTLADGELNVVANRPRPFVGIEAVRRALLAALLLPLDLLGVLLCAPLPVGNRSRGLTGKVDPGCLVEAQLARPTLDDLTLHRVGVAAERVEVNIRGNLQRPNQTHRPVRLTASVVELLLADRQHTGVVDARVSRDHATVERGEGGNWLEDRTGRVAAANRPVKERRSCGFAEQALVIGLSWNRFGAHARVVCRCRAERQHAAITGIECDERASRPTSAHR